MTVQECYEKMEADYNAVFGRLAKDERIKKFLIMFLKDSSYELLNSSIQSKNAEEAFRAAHTLKGVGQNLSLTKLYESASRLSDLLRGKTDFTDDVLPEFETLSAEYKKTIACIKELSAE